MTKITEINIIPVRPKNGLVGFASCVLDEKYYIGSIGIYTKLRGGYRITFPSRKLGHGTVDIHAPVTLECCREIENAIVKEFLEKFNLSIEEVNL